VIERELGEGGMAMVYLADDVKHSRKVALKVLKPELAAAVGADRFLAEIKTTTNLQHPHILPLFDSGEVDSFLFYVMPYVEGETLEEKLEREHQLSVDEAIRIATDIAEALQTAHEHGVVHRDIKPSNILLSSGRPLVADFRIALAFRTAGGDRLTQTGLSMGTPHYMSPEQAAGETHIDARSDIYSLAAMLYEMLAGEPPYTGRTAQVILTKRLTEPVPSLRRIRERVPASIDAALVQALAPTPADRFATTGEFIAALTTLVVDEPKEAVRWKQWTAVGVGGALLAAVGVGMAVLGGGTQEPRVDLPPEPTLEAYDFFLRGRAAESRSRGEEDLRVALQMYEQAVAADSTYALAYVRLGFTHRRLFWFGFERGAETLSKSKAAVDKAFEIMPDLTEAHVARAWYLYQIDRDFDGALATLDLVDPSLDFEPQLRGSIYRRAGDFEAAVRSFSRAFDLFPRSSGNMVDLGNSFAALGMHVQANRSFESAQEIGFPDWAAFWWQAWNHLLWTGDTDLAREALQEAEIQNTTGRGRDWFVVELLAGNYDVALSYVVDAGEWIRGQYGDASRDLLVGEAYYWLGDDESQARFQAARELLQTRLASDVDNPYTNRELAWAHARLGEGDEAIRYAERSVELMPLSRDALVGPDFLRDLAAVYTIVGDHDGAVRTLVEVMSMPGRALSAELLRLDRVWDPLRSNPRFERLVGGS